MTDLRSRVKAALESKRRELIAKPLAQIWDELTDAAIAEAFKWMPIEDADTFDRVLVAGWQPATRTVQGYWWVHEDETDDTGNPMEHTDALKFMPLPPPPASEEGK